MGKFTPMTAGPSSIEKRARTEETGRFFFFLSVRGNVGCQVIPLGLYCRLFATAIRTERTP